MKKILSISILIFFANFIISQNIDNQLLISYIIDASVINKSIIGSQKVEITNKSTKQLDTIYFDLMANAYNAKNSNLGKEYRKNHDITHYGLSGDESGGYSKLIFKIGEKELNWTYANKTTKESVYIVLDKKLYPSVNITIDVDFRLNLPKMIRNIGVLDDAIIAHDWHPKVARFVNDQFLIQEASISNYIPSNFAKFVANITVSKNKEVLYNGFSSTINKDTFTSTYKLTATDRKDVDFIICPAKRVFKKKYAFDNLQYEIRLINFDTASGKHIRLMDSINNKIVFFKDELGKNMNFGFNFIQTNEEFTPDLDGIIFYNSQNEDYIYKIGNQWLQNYNYDKEAEKIMKGLVKSIYKPNSNYDYNVLSMSALFGCSNCNKQYNEITYNAILFAMIKGRMDSEKYQKGNINFLKDFRYRTINKEMIQQYWAFQSTSNFSWFFDNKKYINSNYTIKKADKIGESVQLTIENKSKIAAPLVLNGYKNKMKTTTQWLDGFVGERNIMIEGGKKMDAITLNDNFQTFDFNTTNSVYAPNGLKKIQNNSELKFWKSRENIIDNRLFVLPGYNAYDGIYPMASYNYENLYNGFCIRPMVGYGLKSKKINFIFEIYKTFDFENGTSLEIGLKSRHFGFQSIFGTDEKPRYLTIKPSITFTFKPKEKGIDNTSITYKFNQISAQGSTYENGLFTGLSYEKSNIHQLNFKKKYFRGDFHPTQINVDLEQQSYSFFATPQNYLKLGFTYNTEIFYQKNKSIDFRIFAGGFLQNTGRNAGSILEGRALGSLGLSSQGFNDYTYSDLYLGRTETNGYLSNQIYKREGGMKWALDGSYAGVLGYSNDFIASINLIADLPQDLPLHLPLRPYFDIGYFKNSQPTGVNDKFSDQFIYNGGICISITKNQFEIYLPLISSTNLSNLQSAKANGNYLKQITFMIKGFEKIF
jgi:hypothetical protein